MQETNSNKIPDDEIDITYIARKIYSFIAYPFLLLASNLKTTVFFLVLAVLTAIALKQFIPKAYHSAFIIRPNDPHEKFHIRMLNDIQFLLKKQDYATVASELNIDRSLANTLTDLRVYNSILKASPDSINYTEITIGTTDYNHFIPLQKSLTGYLERNPYFSKLKTLQKKQVAMSLDQMEKDMPQIDSLKKLQLSNYGKQQVSMQSQFLLNSLVDPTSIYTLSNNEIEKKKNLIAQQVFEDNFQVIKSCVVVKNHDWPPRILVMLIYLVPAFLLFCFIFLLLRDQVAKRIKG